MSDGWIITAVGVLIMVGGILLIGTLDYAECRAKTNMMQVERSWGPLQGCMIKHKGQWIPLDRFRVLVSAAR